MAILKVARLGHPVLRKMAAPLLSEEIVEHSTKVLIRDMIETMREYDGMGLAAPQVHVSKQILIMRCESSHRYPGVPDFPLTIMINPVVKYLTDKQIEGWESCLSIPDFRGLVARYQKIQVDYINEAGEIKALVISDFPAVVIQHEYDHLLGKVFIDRIKDLTTLSYQDEYQKYTQEKI